MAIYDFLLSRNNAASTPANYVGHTGRLFYNSTNGEIRLSDGVTPGGLPIPITLATTGTAGSVKPGNGLKVAVDGTISIDATSSFAFVGNKLSLLAAYRQLRVGFLVWRLCWHRRNIPCRLL